MLTTASTSLAPWHATPPEEAAARLDTDRERGLDPEEAARRLARHGPNVLPEAPGRGRFRMLLDQVCNLLVILLLAAAVLAALLGDWTDAIVILAIVVVNGAVGYLQERRAADALAALRRMTAPAARVRRGGRTLLIPAAELVPGDLVVLEAGDHVPADLRLVRSSAFRTVEASLTGESEPSSKDAAARVPPGAPLAERRTLAFLGTAAADGAAEGIVVTTGPATEFGRIAELVRSAGESQTPLQQRLDAFGRWLIAGAGVAVGLVFLLGLLRRVPLVEMLLASVSLAVAAVPEGLPAVVTVALALGVHRMARRKAVVRRLSAVETLGSVTVIASDKTGTLTEGRMSVVRIEGSPGLLHAAAAASTARLVLRDGREEVAGDPMEGAILAAARAQGIEAARLDVEEPVDSLRPFDPQRKWMSVTRRGRTYAKGAPEVLLPRCRNGAGSLPLADAMARDGLRVLAVAEGPDEDALELAGLLGFRDPPRPEARGAVLACRRAGVRPIMITGDNLQTALSLARDVGITDAAGRSATGADLDAWDDARLAEEAQAVAVYARVSPEHKLRIVRALQARGAIVAMTGDGVNDAPALRGADIGVAMGLSGTDVARDASAMVLADDNFATLVAAVEQGRGIYENIRKALLYLLSGNAAEILVMAVAVVAGWPLPLLPIQLLWINLVTDGLPALMLATDVQDGELLRRPPRHPSERLADRDFLVWMVSSAVLAAGCTVAAFLAGWWGEGSLERGRTYAFSILVVEEVLRAFVLRSRTRTVWELGWFSHPRLLGIAVLTIGLQVLGHHWAPLRGLLHMEPLTIPECLLSLAAATIPISVLETWKLVRRRGGRAA